MSQEQSLSSWKKDYVALIGIDWADEEHYYHLIEVGSENHEKGTLKQTPEALDEWMTQLRQRFDGRQVSICLEQSKGALFNGLSKFDFIVLYPLNPKKLKSYRESYTTSGAVNDPTDAELICEYLSVRGHKMKAVKPDTPEARLLDQLTRARREVVDDRTKLGNKLKAELKLYFPQALKLAGENLLSKMALEFLRRWPSLQRVKKTKKRTLRNFYAKHGCRSEEKIKERFELIKQTVSLTDDPAIIEWSLMLVERLVNEISVLNESIEKYDVRIAQLKEEHPDSDIYASLPGAGDVMEPRLAVALGTDRTRWESATEVQTFHGIAPVINQSGKTKCYVHQRWTSPKFLRQTWHEFAGHSRKHCDWANAFYRMKRAEGKGHHAAIRALAYKWIRIIYRCWVDQTPYNDSKYLEALKKSGSKIIEYMDYLEKEKNNRTD